MEELLTKYSLSDILIFIVLLFFAIKEMVNASDWIRDRIKKINDKDLKAKKEHEILQEEIDDLNKFYEEKKNIDANFEKLNKAIDKLTDRIDLLTESDKEDIKAFITNQHHFFVYQQEWIDDYSMECLEKRFAVYEKEHGNSFVLGLMNEIRALPKRPPVEIEHRYTCTAKYVDDTKKK